MAVHETMQRVFELSKLTPTELAIKLDESPQTITNWSRRGISHNGAKKVATEYGVSIDWVLLGENSSDGRISNKMIGVWFDDDIPPLGMIPIDYLKQIKVSAGNGFVNEEVYEEPPKLWFRQETIQECNVKADCAKAIIVEGDSMYPDLSDGQVIAIDTSATRIFDGEIYAFLRDGELKIKYLFNHGTGFKAVSRNDDKLRYPDEIYTDVDIETYNIKILGQYWWKSETKKIRR